MLQSIINGTSAIIFLKDLQGRYLMVNNQFEEVFGLHKEKIKGKQDSEIFSDEIAQVLQKNDSEVIETKETVRWEEDVTHEDGNRTWLYLKFPLLDSGGNPHSLCGVLTDITARKELETRKEDFIRMASHELKTPINSVQIMLEFVKENIEKGEKEEALNKFLKFEYQIEKMTALVDNLLDVSKMEGGWLELKEEEFDLNTLLRETIEMVQSTTANHTILLREQVQQQPLVADRQRLEQVFVNLLTNAIKYSPEGGDIIVRIKRTAEHMVVSVEDFGIGISEEYQEKIFDRFYKDPTSDNRLGLGIGLYITAQIVEHHGGTISVESEKGEGSTFLVELPSFQQVKSAIKI